MRWADKIPKCSDHDRKELALLERFLERRASHPKEALIKSYAEVYGEVVFDGATPQTEGKGDR